MTTGDDDVLVNVIDGMMIVPLVVFNPVTLAGMVGTAQVIAALLVVELIFTPVDMPCEQMV
jgi:hypothetical protein